MKRNYVDEIISKKKRLLKRSNRYEQFDRRIIPLASGFRFLERIKQGVTFRPELLKYMPIGAIACVEGYFKLLMEDLIDAGSPYIDNLKNFTDIKLTMESVLAIHSRKITIGEFVSHLLPVNNVSDINHSISTIIGQDFIQLLMNQPTSEYNPEPLSKVFPKLIGDVEGLFQLRHLYAHELATKETVSIRKIQKYWGSTMIFVMSTEEMINKFMLTFV